MKTLKKRIIYRIKRSSSSVFLRKDFKEMDSCYDQVGRVLSQLVKEKVLIRLGYGVYARAKISKFSSKVIPEKSLPELAKEAAKKLKVKVVPSKLEKAYLQGESNQVPTGRVIGVKKRVCRKLELNGQSIQFETVYGN